MVRILRWVLALGLFNLVACQVTDSTARQPRHYSIEQFLRTTSVGGNSFSPDQSKLLVTSDESGIPNAYSIAIATKDKTQLTHSTTNPVSVIAYFPNDERFLFSQDEGGDERTHIFVQNPDGNYKDLTPGEDVKASFLGFAQDKQSFFVGSNERDPKFFDVYEYSITDYSRNQIYQDTTGYTLAAISPDKQTFALVKTNTTSDNNVYLKRQGSDELTLITPHEGKASYAPQEFTKDGSALLLTADEGAEFSYLAKYDLTSGTMETLLEYPWDVQAASLSESGRFLVVSVNEDARTKIYVYESHNLSPMQLPNLPDGDITGLRFSPDETKVAFYLSDSRHPRDLFVMDLSQSTTVRLTNNLNPEVDAGDLVNAEVVRFESYDGLEVPGILYRPHQASKSNKQPGLVWVHGGPGGQSRVGYSGLIQYLVNHGYVVYAINNRGSSGYGKTFYGLDDRRHGDADLKDCIASKQMLIDTGYVDPERIGIIGGSYGGYMVLAALTYTPDEFVVGVNIFGVANWLRTLESIPSWWESFRNALYEEIGNPNEDREYLIKISPLFHASSIRVPLLVLQGANDPRVLKVESDEIVEAVRANGVPVEYVVFEDEGHGFRKKENQESGYRSILKFLDRYLRG